MKRALPILALLALLAFLSGGSRPLDTAGQSRTFEHLRRLGEQTGALQKDVLKLRQGELLAYDSLDRSIAQLREAARVLSDPPPDLGVARKALAAQTALGVAEIQAVAESVEEFKTRNAILRNSLSYLTAAGPEVCSSASLTPAGRTLSEDLNRLLRDVLSYSITSRSERSLEMKETIAKLRDPASAAGVDPQEMSRLLRHVEMVLRTKEPLDAAVSRVLTSPLPGLNEKLFRAYGAAYSAAQRRVERFRFGLFLAALLGGGTGALLVIRRLTRDAEALRRLNTEKNDFLGIAAHDLKNPLGTIAGYAGFLLEDEELPASERREVLGKILTASQRMLGLIKNLLDVNAIEEGKVNLTLLPLDLAGLAREVVDGFRDKAARKQQPLTFTATGAVPVMADHDALLHVLDNLVSNAIKYSPAGKPIAVTVTAEGGTGRCAVADQGPGLSAADQSKLFGKFARLSARPTAGEHSTGLGLSIVKRIVESMNGRVWCTSELGKGSTFGVDLPSAAAKSVIASGGTAERSSRWASVGD